MKRFISILLVLVMMLSVFTVVAYADELESTESNTEEVEAVTSEPISCQFYILNSGLTVPTGTAPCPNANYSFAGMGTIKADTTEFYAEDGVDSCIVSAPEVPLQEGQTVTWYVVKYVASDGVWHIDGVVTPYWAFLYDPNTLDDVTGSVVDGTHYFEGESATVKANQYVRTGYSFIGWNTAPDGSGTAYAAGDTIAVDSIARQGKVTITTLYAQWSESDIVPIPDPTPDPDPTPGENATIRIDTPKNMAVRMEDGTVYYGGEYATFEVNKEYKFQMCSVNWENGIYDDGANGYCGTVVYTMKLVNEKDFITLRNTALANPDRYTVKGMDIIDNVAKSIVINYEAENAHLETDVNNFFMAYRFHFNGNEYRKGTRIPTVVNTATESLSVNLPLGATVYCEAYVRGNLYKTASVLISNNSGKGIYTSVYLTSVNDYYWDGRTYTITGNSQWYVTSSNCIEYRETSTLTKWPCAAISDLLMFTNGAGSSIDVNGVNDTCPNLKAAMAQGYKFKVGYFIVDPNNGNKILADSGAKTIGYVGQSFVIGTDKVADNAEIAVGVQFFKVKNDNSGSVAISEAEAQELTTLFSVPTVK